MTTYVVVDTGFGHTKSVTLKGGAFQSIKFESVVARASEMIETSLGNRPPADLIELNGSQYMIGDLARGQSRLTVSTIDRSRVHSDEALALVLSALARQFGRSTQDIVLLTTLPDAWRSDAKPLAAKLTGSHEILLGSKRTKRTFSIKRVVVRPQSLGLITAAAFKLGQGKPVVNNQAILSNAVAAVDIGYKTVNLGGFNPAAEHRAQFSGSFDLGVRTLVERITQRIYDDAGTQLSPARISDGFKAGKLNLSGQTISFKNGWVSSLVEEQATSIVSQMRTLWGNGRQFEHIIIGSGGAGVLGQSIKAAYGHPQTILNKQTSQFDVAEGLFLWLLKQTTK